MNPESSSSSEGSRKAVIFSPRGKSQSTMWMLMEESDSSSGGGGLDPQPPYPCNPTIQDRSGGTAESATSAPIRYGSGELLYSETDLVSEGFGIRWGHTRSYGNLGGATGVGNLNGNRWFVQQLPQLMLRGTDQVAVLATSGKPIWFAKSASSGEAREAKAAGGKEALSDDPPQVNYTPMFAVNAGFQLQGDYQMRDVKGRVTLFYGPDAEQPEGTFKGYVDEVGRQYQMTYTSGRPGSFVMSDGSQSAGYYYDYYTSGANIGRLKTVTYMVNGLNVRRGVYTYYGNTGSSGSGSGNPDLYGNLNDLKTARIDAWIGTSWATLKTTYYRYWRPFEVGGFTSGLKYVVGPEGYERMQAAGIAPETAANSTIAIYADYYFEYDIQQRVTREKTNGGLYEYGLSYSGSGFSDGYNRWRAKTEELLPDGSKNIVYTNYANLAMLKIRQSAAGEKWYLYFKYDDQGRGIERGESSAVWKVEETEAALVTLYPTQGLVHTFEYWPDDEGAGSAQGNIKREGVKQGGSGSETTLRSYEYEQRTVAFRGLIYVPSAITIYQNEGLGGSRTEFAYEWGGGFQFTQRTITLPAVTTAQNGSNTANTKVEAYDGYGRVEWTKDERGFITHTEYEATSAALKKKTEDVNTAGGTSGAPFGWTTPSGGGLNLVSDYENDLLGRRTQELGPTHSADIDGTNTTGVRQAKWMVYKDDLDQTWEGAGYRVGTTDTLVNPVKIKEVNKAGRVTDVMEATRASSTGKLISTDSFPQTSWTRWQQNLYQSVIVFGYKDELYFQRRYYLIPGSGTGVKNTNYQEVGLRYDAAGRLNRFQTAGGTILRAVYNAMGWATAFWEGTNDTGATDSNPAGSGSPNNMKQVVANEYDEGYDKGDGNLTQETLYAADADTRVTVYKYEDYRNRRTATDGEVDFYEEYFYDNQDRLIRVDQKNATFSGKLVARRATSYDALGRVYQEATYGVDPVTGTVGNAVTTSRWYDPSGNVIKVQEAGSQAFVKTAYDGIGRRTVEYTAYDLSETSYPYPVSVSGDTVMRQVEYAYDAASHVTSETTRDRFHDATGTGALTTPGGSQPKARVSYIGKWLSYITNAGGTINRQKAAADYGTN